jgi:hypothetical protein
MHRASTPIVPNDKKKGEVKDEERKNPDHKIFQKAKIEIYFVSFFGDASSPSKSRSMTESRSISAVMSAIKS